jgi:hypothetical protein
MNYKSIDIKQDTKLIKRYLDISKPNDVSDIEFELEPTGDEGEYFMNIEYIVPDDSKYLQLEYHHIRFEWNHHITKDIRNYFGLKVIIGVSGIRNEKFNYGK